MKDTIIFPGSFDPFTIGHEALTYRALQLFDKVIIAVGYNSDKKYMFDINSRIEIIKQTFINESRVEVIAYKGLTVNLCDNLRVYTILRGLRNTSDFEFESAISHINKQLNNKIETIFMLISAQQASISSSIVRDIIINNGDVSQFMPNAININNYQRLY